MARFYTLDERDNPVLVCTSFADKENVEQWRRWMKRAEQSGRLQIDYAEVDGQIVNTVFTGYDAGEPGDGTKPEIFEVRLSKDSGSWTAGRPASMRDAKELHKSVVRTLRDQAKKKRSDSGN